MRLITTTLLFLTTLGVATDMPAQVTTRTEGGEGSSERTESSTEALPDGYSAKDGNGNEVVIEGGAGAVEFTGTASVDHQTKCITISGGSITAVTNYSGRRLTVEGSNITATNWSQGATVTMTGDNNTVDVKNSGFYRLYGNSVTVNVSSSLSSGSTFDLNGGVSGASSTPGSGRVIYSGSLNNFVFFTNGQYTYIPTKG